MNEMLKFLVLSFKILLLNSTVLVFCGLIVLVSFIPQIPLFMVIYFFVFIVILITSLFSRTPYWQVLPVSMNAALNARFLISVLFFMVQLFLYIIGAIIRRENPISDIILLMFTVLNCIPLLLSFFYTKKRAILSALLIGAFAGGIANIFLVSYLADLGLGLGLLPAFFISLALWGGSYFGCRKLIKIQYVA